MPYIKQLVTQTIHTMTEKREKKMRKQKGFSLIELLIVVAIILIIAAIAIPNLLRARIAANESSAVSSVRTINTAEVTYLTAYPQVGYSATLVALGPGAGVQACPAGGPASTAACLIDAVLANNLATGGKSGYTVDAIGAVVAPATTNVVYGVGAAPIAFNQTGVRRFCSAEDGVLRADPNTAGSVARTTGGMAACSAAPYAVLQ
jgi:type IV pilus assembly protein PilA